MVSDGKELTVEREGELKGVRVRARGGVLRMVVAEMQGTSKEN